MAGRKTASAASTSGPIPATPPTSTRKTWVKKTPVDVVLDQIGKQEKKVADMRAELTHQEHELAKLQKAKTVLEGA